jgi:hypothetical protein
MGMLREYILAPTSLFYSVVDFLLRRKKLLALIVVVFFTILGISVLCRGGIGPPPRRTDLTVFLRAAEAIRSGEHIYYVANARGWHYMYPPLFATLLMPFTKFPLLVNTTLWYMLSVASFFGTVILSSRFAEDRAAGMRASVMAALFCAPPLLEVMTRGQIDMMVVFLAVAVLYLYFAGRDVWAALLLAFAVVLKVSPLALIVVFFLVKKEWKFCAAFCLGGIFFTLVFPSLILGAERNWFFLTEWNRIMSHAASEAGHKSHIWQELINPFATDNLSLYSVFTRWAWPSEAALAGNSNFLIRWGVRVSGGAALLVLAFFSRGKADRKTMVLEYSLFSFLMIFISPVSSLHHFIFLFPMFFAAFLYLNDLPKGSALYRSISWGTFIAALTYLLGLSARKPFSAWGLPILGALVLWCVLLAVLIGRASMFYPDQKNKIRHAPGQNA